MKRSVRWIAVQIGLLFSLLAVWVVLARELSAAVLVAGLAFAGIVVLFFPSGAQGLFPLRVLRRSVRFLLFLPFAAREIFLASWKLAWLAVIPSIPLRSWVFAHDYTLKEHSAVLLLSTIITLTPGTLVLDIAPHRCRLYIHCLDNRRVSAAAQRSSIRQLESRVARVFA